MWCKIFAENSVLGEYISGMKMRYKKLGENFILTKRFIVKNSIQNSRRKFYTQGKKFLKWKCMYVKNLQKKIDKLSIRDCGTVEKINQKLENCISFE